MCGINGIISNIGSDSSIENINIMNNLIIHRGPDSEGFYAYKSKSFDISMSMRRLSIIDLSSGNQPIYSDDNSKVIVFNGEIYNYQSLKNNLIDKGCTFKTNSDTEVILKLYEIEGVTSFGQLDGMFAFSIFDKKIGKVFIARDFFGEKLLYYSQRKDGFIWASELKSLVSTLSANPEIDRTSLALYFQLTYIPSPYTIYQGVNTKYFYNKTGTKPGICTCSKFCKGQGGGSGEGECKRITMSIFRTGRIIITGAREMDQIQSAYEFLNGVFEAHSPEVLLKRVSVE